MGNLLANFQSIRVIRHREFELLVGLDIKVSRGYTRQTRFIAVAASWLLTQCLYCRLLEVHAVSLCGNQYIRKEFRDRRSSVVSFGFLCPTPLPVCFYQ